MQQNKNQIKVLHFIDHMGAGGAQILLNSLLPALKDYGFNVQLFVLGKEAFNVEAIRAAGVPVTVLNLSKYSFLKARTVISQIFANLQPTIVHTHLDKANFLVATLANKAKVPVIIKHDHSSTWPSLKTYFFSRWLMEKIFSTKSQVVAVSQAVKQFNLAIGVEAERIWVIKNGIDLTKFQFKSRWLNGTPVIGYIGRFHFKKGVKYLVKAAPFVLKRYPQAKFVLVGDGPEKDSLLRLSQRLGIQDKVIFLGKQKNVTQFYAQFTVFVMPSLYDACPLALMEAMASGCPVVGTNTGGVQEIITPNVDGLIVKTKDAKGLAAKILYLLDNPNIAAQLIENAQKKRAHFCLKLTIDKLLSLYQTLLANSVRDSLQLQTLEKD